MMIIVGCLDFYRSVVEFAGTLPDANVGFLKLFLDALGHAKDAGDATIIDFDKMEGSE